MARPGHDASFELPDGRVSPLAHRRWYADRIARSELVVFPGAGHLDTIDGHWSDVVIGLLAIWA